MLLVLQLKVGPSTTNPVNPTHCHQWKRLWLGQMHYNEGISHLSVWLSGGIQGSELCYGGGRGGWAQRTETVRALSMIMLLVVGLQTGNLYSSQELGKLVQRVVNYELYKLSELGSYSSLWCYSTFYALDYNQSTLVTALDLLFVAA